MSVPLIYGPVYIHTYQGYKDGIPQDYMSVLLIDGPVNTHIYQGYRDEIQLD